jgi:hypothetical protein
MSSLTIESRRERHWLMLGVAAGVVLMALALEVVPGGRVAFVGFSDYPLPHSCLSKAWFGTSCPGCGLTRSFVYLAHGDWRSSLAMHHLGWLMFLAVLAQFPYRIAALACPNREVLGILIPKLFGYTLIALLLVNWLIGVVADRL